MTRIMIRMHDAISEMVVGIAENERRDPRVVLEMLIEEGLKQRGLLQLKRLPEATNAAPDAPTMPGVKNDSAC